MHWSRSMIPQLANGIAVIVAILVFIAAKPGSSAPHGRIALEKRVAVLESMVKELSARIDRLEEKLSGVGSGEERWSFSKSVREFKQHTYDANKDGLTNQLVNLAANAYQYKIRPRTMGGGGGSYQNYVIPTRMLKDYNGYSYVTGTVMSNSCQIVGTSAINTSWKATCTVDDTGRTMISYSGW